jgi:RND family efflux transporter MFP subunit
MNFVKNFSLLAAMLLPVIFTISYAGSEHKTTRLAELEHVESTLIFTTKQMQLANISVVEVKPRYMDKRLYAPAEVQVNGYTSYVVSPRVESVIVKRHAILGEHVTLGQPLVTLFSETVAEAQASYRITYADWQRAKSVDRSIISDSQLLTAETDYIAAFGRLKAYGLSKKAIAIIADDHSSSLGEYTLKAERAGVVLSDDFQQGQRVSAGDSIMVLADESELWVEARLAANDQSLLLKGTKAEVVLASRGKNNVSYQAEVIQQAHTIDPTTRTRVVRLKVKNSNHQLHPGLFVDVYFSLKTSEPILAVPETALIRSADGDWQVYVQQDDFKESTFQKSNEQHGENEQSTHAHDGELDNNVAFTAHEVTLGALYRVYSQEQ